MTELEKALRHLIDEAESKIATAELIRGASEVQRGFDTMRDAISTLKISLKELERSAGEHEILVGESRLALGTIEGRMLSGDWEGARDYVENVPFRSVVAGQEKRFRSIAAKIYTARNDRRLGMFVEQPRAVILENIRSTFGMPKAERGTDEIRSLISELARLRSWPRNIDAALYWIAHAAEQAYLTSDLPSKPEEDDFNAALPAALQSAAKEHWPSMVTALGYSSSLPFEIGRFTSTRKTIEPQTGLDFALLVYSRLEDGNPRIYTAIVQGKPEHAKKPFTANVYRRSKTYGKNHQLRTLADKVQTSYYAFYPRNRVTSPTSIVPVKTIVDEFEGRHPGVALEAMKYSDCYVSTENGAVDLPTFFAKLMTNHTSYETMAAAMKDLGSPRPSLGDKAQDMSQLLAKRLILVQVGSRIPEAELKPIFDLGYERSADLGLTWEMRPGGGGGMPGVR